VGEESRDVQVDLSCSPSSRASAAARDAIERESTSVLEFAKVVDAVRSLAATPLGRTAADDLRPNLTIDDARRALEETTEMRTLLESGTRIPLGAARDVRSLLDRLHERGRPLELPEILDVVAAMQASQAVHDLFDGLPDSAPRLRDLAPRLDRFVDVLETLDSVIDPARGVCDDASPKLLELRSQRRSLERRLSEEANRLASSSRFREHLQSSAVSRRNGRFVLPVRAESRFAVRGILHDRSHSGSTVFVEPEELVEPGNQLVSLLTEESKEETRILWEITRDVLGEEARIREAVEALARIDLVVAKARLSLAIDGVPATISSDGVLELWEARHPVLAIIAWKALENGGLVHPVVPVDLRLGDEFHLLVITGPNTGGKTVTLKTVGLMALMVRAGLHVPARPGCKMPFFDLVCADIGDEQSIEQSLSTFSSHVTRLVQILAHSDSRTLVLVDELGAGTDPAEGAALSLGVLDFLYSRSVPTLVTTHIGSLKTYAFTHPKAQNASVEFDSRTLAPTFRLAVGLAGHSNALAIARRLGMPDEVLARAEETLARERPDGLDLIESLQQTRTAAEESRRVAEVIRGDLERRSREMEDERRRLAERRDLVDKEADVEIDDVLKQTRDRLAPLLSQLKNVPKPFDDLSRRIEDALAESLRASPLQQKRLAFISTLRKDDWVRVPKLGQRGRVKRVDDKRQVLTLQLGALTVDVPFDEVGVETE
jgi:DNA mismatch repair protein MutS2